MSWARSQLIFFRILPFISKNLTFQFHFYVSEKSSAFRICRVFLTDNNGIDRQIDRVAEKFYTIANTNFNFSANFWNLRGIWELSFLRKNSFLGFLNKNLTPYRVIPGISRKFSGNFLTFFDIQEKPKIQNCDFLSGSRKFSGR